MNFVVKAGKGKCKLLRCPAPNKVNLFNQCLKREDFRLCFFRQCILVSSLCSEYYCVHFLGFVTMGFRHKISLLLIIDSFCCN